MRSFVVLLTLGGIASAAPMAVTGTVTDATSLWTDDGSRIVTDATLRPDDGSAPIVVRQLGGSVDGLGMITFPSPERLVVGMHASVVAHDGYDLAQQRHLGVDEVTVLDRATPDFVRSGPTKAGHFLYWESGCIFVTYDSAGTAELAGDTEFAIIDASIATWNTGVASCSYLKVMKQGTKPMEVGKDEINVIKFRDTTWGRPAVGNDMAQMYPASAAGITTATYIDDSSSSRDGAIVDADIEINGVNFAISDNGVTLGTQPCHAELQNTMTHELGHLHGLAHTCRADYDDMSTAAIDSNGNPVPLCSATTDMTIIEATMYPYQDCGETKKETLEADDISGICTVYPTAKDPNTCTTVQSPSGCCSANGPAGGPAALSGLVLLVVLRRRRRPTTRQQDVRPLQKV